MNIGEVEQNVADAARLLKAMANEKRLQILCALHKKAMKVNELEQVVGLSQSALSQHLAKLRRDGLVKTRREAQAIYYSLSHVDAERILQTLSEIMVRKGELPEDFVRKTIQELKQKELEQRYS